MIASVNTMDLEATKPLSDAEYDVFIDCLSYRITQSLRHARDMQESPDSAIRDYLTTAYKAGISTAEALDFFGVSTPSIAEAAGFAGNDLQQVMERFDAINSEIAPQFFK